MLLLTKVSSCGFTGEPKAISTEGTSSDNNLTDNSGIGDGVESYKGKSKLTTNPKTPSSMTYKTLSSKMGMILSKTSKQSMAKPSQASNISNVQ